MERMLGSTQSRLVVHATHQDDKYHSVLSTMIFCLIGCVLHQGLVRVFCGKIRPIERKKSVEKGLAFLFERVFLTLCFLDSERFQRWPAPKNVVIYVLGLLFLSVLRRSLCVADQRLEHLCVMGQRHRSLWPLFVILAIFNATLHVIVYRDLEKTIASASSIPNLVTSRGLFLLLLYDGMAFMLELALVAFKYSALMQEEKNEADDNSVDNDASLQRAGFFVSFTTFLLKLIHLCHNWMLKGLGVRLVDFVYFIMFQRIVGQLVYLCRDMFNALSIARSMDGRFADASQAELLALSHDTVCSICLKHMKHGVKKLACGHLLHGPCLLQCLEKIATSNFMHGGTESARCPLCRALVEASDEKGGKGKKGGSEEGREEGEQADGTAEGRQEGAIVGGPRRRALLGPSRVLGGLRNAPLIAREAAAAAEGPGEGGGGGGGGDRPLLRISTDALGMPAWLPIPSFSLELVRRAEANSRPSPSRRQLPGRGRYVNEGMIAQVLEVLPHIPRHVIIEDLSVTGRVDVTIENLLNAPPSPQQQVVEASAVNSRENAGDEGRAQGLAARFLRSMTQGGGVGGSRGGGEGRDGSFYLSDVRTLQYRQGGDGEGAEAISTGTLQQQQGVQGSSSSSILTGLRRRFIGGSGVPS